MFCKFSSAFGFPEDPHLQPLWDAFDLHWGPDSAFSGDLSVSENGGSSESLESPEEGDAVKELLAIEDKKQDDVIGNPSEIPEMPATKDWGVGEPKQPQIQPLPERVSSDPATRAKLIRMEMLRLGGANYITFSPLCFLLVVGRSVLFCFYAGCPSKRHGRSPKEFYETLVGERLLGERCQQ